MSATTNLVQTVLNTNPAMDSHREGLTVEEARDYILAKDGRAITAGAVAVALRKLEWCGLAKVVAGRWTFDAS